MDLGKTERAQDREDAKVFCCEDNYESSILPPSLCLVDDTQSDNWFAIDCSWHDAFVEHQ